jgi:Phage integrase family/Arm DNA-binding domain
VRYFVTPCVSVVPYGGTDETLKRGASKMPEKLTAKLMQDVAAPPKGDRTIWDGGHAKAITGFGARINAGGKRSFFLNYRDTAGRERRYTIGTFPTWSVEAARERAKELRRLIDTGQDPAGEKRERREAPTVGDLIERYVRDHLPTKTATGPHRRSDELKMLAEIEQRLGKHTKVRDVHDGDIRKMHGDITASQPGRPGRPIRANRILAIASKMFSLSLSSRAGENAPWRDAAMGNPCKGVARNPEQGRDRFFSQAELAAIGDALASYKGEAANCLRLTMLSGCRPSEAMQAKWEEFDAEPGYWIKPSAHVKQRRQHKLPLNPAALELIERMRSERRKASPWLFHGDVPGQELRSLFRVWEHVKRHTGIDGRVYDLRHSFASMGAAGGLSLLVIGRLLGHTKVTTTQKYAHLADDALREATNRIGAAITGRDDANVVPLAEGRRR